jgi:rRNA maturation protein Nop10
VKIVHRVTTHLSHRQAARLRALGVELLPGPQTFSVSEDMTAWPEVSSIIRENDALDVVHTRFSKHEVQVAPCVRLGASTHVGFPQPEEDYLRVVYDLREWCARCGAGARQIAPFRLLAEPKWGRRLVLQLNWVFDEFFTTPSLWREFLHPLGVTCQPVLSHRTSERLESIVQLSISACAEGSLSLLGHPAVVCENCGRRKFLPFVRGCLPCPVPPTDGSGLFRSQEWFGDGASARREVFAVGAVASALKKLRPGGLIVEPTC